MKRAIVLLSGGLDSATALGCALEDGYECYALTFKYGQRHVKEVEAAENVIEHYVNNKRPVGHFHQEISFPVKPWSALTSGREVPTEGYEGGIPATYVAGRNTIFLAFAASLAETMGAERIYVGFNDLDYSGYPDCRPEYVNAFQVVLNRGTKAGQELRAPQITAPLLGLTKADVLRKAVNLAVPHYLTWSCYKGENVPCGKCDSCRFRDKAYEEVFGTMHLQGRAAYKEPIVREERCGEEIVVPRTESDGNCE